MLSKAQGRMCTPTPINLHEYQKKELVEIAIRKRLIVKGMLLVVLQQLEQEPWH
jgi:hypothetical protein